VNKNPIPFDPLPPKITSGIRLGTPAVTTRGMKEPEMRLIADFIDQVLSAPEDEDNLAKVGAQVKDFCRSFPLFAEEWKS